LPNGRRVGNYWVIGDARNTPGRSTYIRLFPDYAGKPAGRWTDAATGEYGDLLDIIRYSIPSGRFDDAIAEAEAFVGGVAQPRLPRFRADLPRRSNHERQARRLYADASAIPGTLAEAYLRNRGINPALADDLRFAPQCYCRPSIESDRHNWPALIAPVTDAHDRLTGAHRIYLDPSGAFDAQLGKAPLERPKRSLGAIHGNAVRFGAPAPVVAVAEGIENALSVRTAMPELTLHAALTAGNLAAYSPPANTKRLLIAVDDDDAGWWAADTLADRSRLAGLPVVILKPRDHDHNRDLRTLGLAGYRASLRDQLPAA
jgi:hypothetical protein